MLTINDEWSEQGTKAISSDVIHKKPEAYLAELMMLNRHPELKDVEFFWRKPEYKESYVGMLTTVKNHIEAAGFVPVHKAIVKNNLTSIGIKDMELIAQEI